MFRKWGEQFVEGNVYIITFFHLIPNLGAYRPTDHAFRILFNPKTKIIPAESSIIPRWGFSLKDSAQLNDDGFQTEYLVGGCFLTMSLGYRFCLKFSHPNISM